MIIEYTGRHTAVTAKLKAQAETGLARMNSMIGGACSAHVILTVDKYRHTAEISMFCSGQTLVATCEATAMDVALHDALARLEQQWVRRNQKFTTMKRHPKEALRTAALEPIVAPDVDSAFQSREVELREVFEAQEAGVA